MIIQEAVSAPIITSIGATPSKFRIKASARAFKILSGFYSEPILAIPRELGANAWDAHVAANNTEQMFEVHAPNSLEPWFSIRDFGTGLSPEDIDQIYTTYFESTKTNENDSDGCMGLGSKTPFNYTENFTVVSYFAGIKYVYNCFIDEAGSPNILAVARERTKEHNGLEVKFGVKISDVSMFTEKIRRAYEPFRFRPIINGQTITFVPREYVFEGTKWGMRKRAANSYNREDCRAFMGNYSYPINYAALRGYIGTLSSSKVPDISRISSILSNGEFDLFFEIGDLEVAPNKEQLQYDGDNKTAKAIVDRLLVAIDELRQKVRKTLDVPKSLWEAMSLYAHYNGYDGEFTGVRRIIGDIAIVFQGETITSDHISIDSIHRLTLMVKTLYPPMSAPAPLVDKFGMHQVAYRPHSDKFVLKSSSYYQATSKGDHPLFLYTAEDNLKRSRMRHFLKNKFVGTTQPKTFVVVDKSPNFKTLRAHFNYLGIPFSDAFHIESLPKPPRMPRAARIASTDEINFCDLSKLSEVRGGYHSYDNVVRWNRTAANFTSTLTYYYVDFYYASPTWKTKDISDDVTELFHYIKNNKLIGTETTIYGINVKNQHLLKVGKWVNVIDLVEKHAKKHQTTFEQNAYLSSLSPVLASFSNLKNDLSTSFISKIKNKKTIQLFESFIELTKAVTTVPANENALCKLFDFKAVKHQEPACDLKVLSDILDNKYMGVFDMCDRYYHKRQEKITQIVNFIDEKS